MEFWNEQDILIEDIVNTICPNNDFRLNFGIQFITIQQYLTGFSNKPNQVWKIILLKNHFNNF